MIATNHPAHDDMTRQLARSGSSRYSLDSMWRAAGKPPGKDPVTWYSRVSPEMERVAAFVATWRDEGSSSHATGVIDLVTTQAQGQAVESTTLDSPHRQGDAMAVYFVAKSYACYLDGRKVDGVRERLAPVRTEDARALEAVHPSNRIVDPIQRRADLVIKSAMEARVNWFSRAAQRVQEWRSRTGRHDGPGQRPRTAGDSN